MNPQTFLYAGIFKRVYTMPALFFYKVTDERNTMKLG